MFFHGKATLERNAVLQRFRLLFRFADRKELAGKLGVSEKQVSRYLQDESAPTQGVFDRIRDLLDDVARDPNIYGLLEQMRADESRRQATMPHLELVNVEKKDVPGWYADVRRDIAERRYPDALLVLRQRRKYADDWDRIPEKTKPYVLGSLGLVNYYSAEWSEAEACYRAALAESRAIRNDTPLLFLAAHTSNLGLSLMRQVKYAEAFRCFDEAAVISPTFLANYYNGICAASQMANHEWVGSWSGRMSTAAIGASSEDIREVLDHHADDMDLVFARSCDSFALAIEHLTQIIKDRGK